MKKILSTLLAALMLLSLFAGCSIQPNPYKDDPEAAEEAPAEKPKRTRKKKAETVEEPKAE